MFFIMSIKSKLRNSPIGILIRREYWRHHIQKDLKKYSDYEFIKKSYEKLGRKLNLANPSRYTEKLQWLKLFWRDDLAKVVSDKYEVRSYLKDIGHEELLNDLIAVYDDVNDFNPAKLPNQFVLKAAHGSGWNLIVKDKSKINWFWWKKIMRSWMKQSLYWYGREWNYKDQKPRIIVEKYLQDDSGELRDFKVFCFNGNPHYIQIDENRFSNHKRLYIDCHGNKLDICDSHAHSTNITFDFNQTHRDMIEIAKELSAPFPHVRVDFYYCNNKIYFGELTFFDGSGFYSFSPDEWDEKIGNYFELPTPNHNLDLYKKIRSESQIH